MKSLAFLIGVCCSLLSSLARADFPTLALKPICLSQFNSPTAVTNAGDGSNRLFLCEQRGKIRIIQNGMLLPTPFLDVGSKLVPPFSPTFDERGLLGLAFHPGFANPASLGYRKFYIFYSAVSPNAPGTTTDPVNCRSTISEYLVSAGDANIADPLSERILLSYDKPQFNHNGGQLEFGPDGLLYISTGDGGGANDNNFGHTGGGSGNPMGVLGNAQDKTRLLGKILRIDPFGTDGPGGQYGIPASNPFVGVGGGIREEIYAFGLRNPWRFSFDPPTGRLFCADVGQGKVEEIDLISSGGNFGWRVKEGSFDFDATAPNGGLPLIAPIAQYEHPGLSPSLGLPAIGISVTGGYVYRGTAIPQLVGKYIFGDWSTSFGTPAAGTLLGLEETTPNNWTLSVLPLTQPNPIPTRILAFGRDEQGEIYVATNVTTGPAQNDPATGLPAGGLYKIVAAVDAAVTREPSIDNTMYAESPGFSNGQGHLFSGFTVNGPNERRALIAFNLTNAVPAGAPVTSATLDLTVTKVSIPNPHADFTLHKVGELWGEGGSDAGSNGGAGALAQTNDATWSHRLFDSAMWTTPGGVFNSVASGAKQIGDLGPYTFNDAPLADDVRSWIANPSQNFGWILISENVAGCAKQFASGEDPTAAFRPKLTINYKSAPALTRREQWLQQYFFVGQFVDDFADNDGDGFSNGVEYAAAASPIVATPNSPPMQINAVKAGATTTFTITFRRDPRATDLTYRLQTSSDLTNWTTVVQSIGGGAPTGSAFVSDIEISGEAPVRIVTARETVGAEAKRFARLQVARP
jgi:glucose/arabinose dehydrogenase